MSAPHLQLEELGGRPLTEAERGHARACPPCAEELARRDALSAALRSLPPEALSQQIRQAARAELARSPVARPWQRAWAAASGLALLLALPALALHLRPDWPTLPGGARLLNLLLLAAVFASATAASFWPGLRVHLLPAALLTAASAAALVVLPGEQPGEPAGQWGCLLGVLLFSAAPLGALLALLRREELGRARGLLAALGAGALGELMLFRHCPVSSLSHIAGPHLLGWALLAGLGAWAGGRLRAPLWRPRA